MVLIMNDYTINYELIVFQITNVQVELPSTVHYIPMTIKHTNGKESHFNYI